MPLYDMEKHTRMYAYNVYFNGKLIDTVFYTTEQDAEDVKRSLVNHDGYDSNIVVELDQD